MFASFINYRSLRTEPTLRRAPAALKTLAAIVAVITSLCVFAPAHAYLGGFEPADGYTLSAIPQGSNPASVYSDVTYYNAGQSGANAGGGVPTTLAPDSGLWKLVSQPGAFFRTSAVRSTYTGTAPPYGAYPTVASGDGVPAYIVGNHGPGYLSPSALALRNETPQVGPPIGGPMDYDYRLDTFDFGGPAPASVTSGTVTTSFRFCPNPSDPVGIPPRDKFVMSFKDTGGNIGLQIGYAGDNNVYWRPGSSGAWNFPGIIANSSNWDQFSVSIDLSAGTFGIGYHQIGPNISSTLAPAGTPLGATMQDLTHLGWWLNDLVLGGTGGKNFFDNFGLTVSNIPEPSSLLLLTLGACGVFIPRRRRPAC